MLFRSAKAVVSGPSVSSEDCEIIKESDPGFKDALKACLEAQKNENQEIITNLQNANSELEQKLSQN